MSVFYSQLEGSGETPIRKHDVKPYFTGEGAEAAHQ